MTPDNRMILLVEDNIELNEINRRALEGEGYIVLTALTLRDAREHLSRLDPDVILLDVVLPDGSGFDLCEEIRSETKAHIIFLTSRRELEDKISGMLLGGDDYITKPFKLEEMLVRVAAAMRRRGIDAEPVRTIKKNKLTIDTTAGQSFVGGEDLLLTPKEFSLLCLFARNENSTLSAEYLYEEVWKQPLADDKRSLKKHISELRNKLSEIGCEYTVVSIYGKGYCFEKNTQAER